TCLEGIVKVDTRRVPSRHQSENNSGGDGNEQSESENGAIKLDRADTRNILRDGHDERLSSPFRDQQTEQAADSGKQQAFREQLTNDSPATCAKRRAQSDLLSAHRRARKHQIRNIGI